MNYHTRREQLARCLRDENLDGLLISNPVNVTYLTGFSGDSSYLILSRGKTLLVSDGRYAEQIIEECPGLEAHIRPPEQRLQEAVVEVLNKLSIRSLGFESGSLSVAESEALKNQTPAIDWKGGTDRVEQLRVIKEEAEIARIRVAIRMAERAFAMLRAMLRPDDTERELRDALEMYVRRAGGTCSSFAAIVAVGDRSARPHARPTDRRLSESALLLVDWGACEGFYKSDLTRVLLTRKNLCFSRTPHDRREADKLEQVYGVVLKAQEQALRAIRPGAKASDVDAAARSVIADAGYGQCFTHGLGHGIGLQVHEAPAIRTNSPDVLQTGMVFTVEPGIYLPGWGGVRIEDDVRVTPDGVEVLTNLPRDWASIHVEA